MSRIEDGGAVEAGLVERLANGGHTPGPWVSFYKSKYDEHHVALPVSGSSMKAFLCPDGIQSGNREADARLIAAAPELLNVAIQQAAEITRLRAENAGKDADIARKDEALREALAAVLAPAHDLSNGVVSRINKALRSSSATLSNSSQTEGQTP